MVFWDPVPPCAVRVCATGVIKLEICVCISGPQPAAVLLLRLVFDAVLGATFFLRIRKEILSVRSIVLVRMRTTVCLVSC